MWTSEDWGGSAGKSRFGLSDEDVLALLKVVRARTKEDILRIESTGEHAEVLTGRFVGGRGGRGREFVCERHGEGWRIKKETEWLA